MLILILPNEILQSSMDKITASMTEHYLLQERLSKLGLYRKRDEVAKLESGCHLTSDAEALDYTAVPTAISSR